MTRFGIGRRVAVYAKAAIATCPSLQGRNVTPHCFRHYPVSRIMPREAGLCDQFGEKNRSLPLRLAA